MKLLDNIYKKYNDMILYWYYIIVVIYCGLYLKDVYVYYDNCG